MSQSQSQRSSDSKHDLKCHDDAVTLNPKDPTVAAASSCQSCPDGASFRPTGDLSHLSRPASLIGGQQANLKAFTEMQGSVGAAETNDDVAAQVVADPVVQHPK
jgi:hypothetical protein